MRITDVEWVTSDVAFTPESLPILAAIPESCQVMAAISESIKNVSGYRKLIFSVGDITLMLGQRGWHPHGPSTCKSGGPESGGLRGPSTICITPGNGNLCV